MDSIESLCKEFIDQEEKDELLDDDVSERSDYVPEVVDNNNSVKFNNKNTSLSNLDNTDVNKNVESSNNFKINKNNGSSINNTENYNKDQINNLKNNEVYESQNFEQNKITNKSSLLN